MNKGLKIGIIVADSEEYKPLEEYIEKGDFSNYSFLGRKGHSFKINAGENSSQVVSLLCGIGKVNAAAVAAHFADNGFDIVLNYGLSGGISGISRGEICACTRFSEHDFNLTGLGYKLCEKPEQRYIYNASEYLNRLFLDIIPRLKLGAAVSGDCFVSDDGLRLMLKNEFGAMSCDMETAAIAYVCDFAGIPFAALRKISDDAGDEAGESYREMNNTDQALLSDYIIEIIKRLTESGFENKL